ncbi:MAG: hypothetical protein ETSY1_07760 [Candidatus Entotheonella factor]|uniref:Uncharacterized protein n=1 Tax=Entotheonella factor TaxID=1429438 RepID=W4LTI1_ENTF1|nr:MAG: hypothetical protein ETSY1_07760 [Candidatus Entotheonella factor]
MTTLSALASLPLTILIGTSAVSGPLGILALAATGLWGFVYGWTTSGQDQLNEARTRLFQQVSSLMQDVRDYFFNTELTAESLSVVDQYFEGLRQLTSERIETLATEKAAEAQAEVARLLQHAPLDDAQRQVKARELQQHIDDWNAIDTAIQQLMATLNTLEHADFHDLPTDSRLSC